MDDDLLKVVSSVKIDEAVQSKSVHEEESHQRTKHGIEAQQKLTSPEHALQILKKQPAKSEVLDVLRFLDPASTTEGQFNVTVPSSTAAQIVHVIVSVTIPDHWHTLSAGDESALSDDKPEKGHKPRAALLRCLSSVAGVGAVVAQLRKLFSSQTTTGQDGKHAGTQTVIRELLTILSSLLKPRGVLLHMYTDISKHIQNPVQRQVAWKELVSLLAAGKVLSTTAEAFKFVGDVAQSSFVWMGEGPLYSEWVGEVISHMAIKLQPEDTNGWAQLSTFTGRALSLGYTDQLVGKICSEFLLGQDFHSDKLGLLLDGLRRHEQIKVLGAILHMLEAQCLSPYYGEAELLADTKVGTAIAGVSAVVAAVLQDRPFLREQLNEWLVSGVGGNVASISMRRALLAIYENEADTLQEILRKGVDNFGDKLVILHSPTGAQEANAQVILLAAGYLHRSHPTEFANVTRSGPYLSAVSNRIAASSTRARFLGMVVAMAFSKLIDPAEKAMKFDLEEVETDEARWYMNLPQLVDHIGVVDNLRNLGNPRPSTSSQNKRSRRHSKSKPKPENATSKIVSIQEVSEESEDEDEDLVSYEKPDTDASDSEEDPTLIQRSKPNAPVYVRDLLVYLRDTENVDRYHLGISSAPDLIRRKASFGTEVVENAKDLALVVVGLQDKYKLPKFHELQIQSLVALLVAYPLTMGKWAAHTLFNSDLSQSQRTAVLVATGLSARELAGLKDEDAKMLQLPPPTPDSTFPSKRLPEKWESIYSESPKSIEAISKNVSQKTLQPMALNAADAVTGPNALKVRTFSSRMEVEEKRKQREQQRKQKSLSKDLHRSLSDGFFFPLLNEFGLMMYSMSSFSGYNPFLEAHLLSLFIQTITLILSTLGPHTPNLSSLTLDSLTLLINLHTSPVAAEPVVLTALLRLFLAILDVNVSSGSTAEERLVTEFSTQVMEMREWVDGVFERAPKENEDVRMLAAGVMVKLGEVTERYQGRLLGINSGFAY